VDGRLRTDYPLSNLDSRPSQGPGQPKHRRIRTEMVARGRKTGGRKKGTPNKRTSVLPRRRLPSAPARNQSNTCWGLWMTRLSR